MNLLQSGIMYWLNGGISVKGLLIFKKNFGFEFPQ